MLPLISLRLIAVLALLCLAATAVVIRPRLVLGAHPALVRLASGLLALVVLMGGVGAAVNRHYGLYRTWADLLGTHSPDLVTVHGQRGLQSALATLPLGSPTPRHGTLFQIRIPGPRSGVKPRLAFVYLPPQYRDPLYSTANFPVVEAFQGSPGRPSDWIRGLHLDRVMDAAILSGRVAPSIVVMPDTNGGLARSLECADTADGKNDEQFLVSDVHAWVDQNLRGSPGRWLGLGYSTGGYCALDLSLRHPDHYFAAVSLDGYAHALQDHYARGIWHSVADRLAHSPDWWVAHNLPELVDVYLLAGLDDPSSVREAVRFWDELKATHWLGRHDRLVVQPGGRHTFPAWEAALTPSLEWALPGPAAPASAQAPVDSQALLAGLPTPSPSVTPSAGPCPTSSPGSPTPSPEPSRASSRPTPRPTPHPTPRATVPPTPSPAGAPSPTPSAPAGRRAAADPVRVPAASPSPTASDRPSPSAGCASLEPRRHRGQRPPAGSTSPGPAAVATRNRAGVGE